ncbi:MAG: rhodanese-like domain-containing protein [Peptoniphilaceae bacterium]
MKFQKIQIILVFRVIQQAYNDSPIKVPKSGSIAFVLQSLGDHSLSDFEIKINGQKVDLQDKFFDPSSGASPLMVLRPADSLSNSDGEYELLDENRIEIRIINESNDNGNTDSTDDDEESIIHENIYVLNDIEGNGFMSYLGTISEGKDGANYGEFSASELYRPNKNLEKYNSKKVDALEIFSRMPGFMGFSISYDDEDNYDGNLMSLEEIREKKFDESDYFYYQAEGTSYKTELIRIIAHFDPEIVGQQGVLEMIETNEALDMIRDNNKDLVVFDVRTNGEYQESRIKSDKLIHKDMLKEDEFNNYLSSLDKDKTYLVYCRTQTRSKKVASSMSNAGFKKVYYMNGGITKWLKEADKKGYTVFPKTPLALDLTINGDKKVYSKGNVDLNIKLTNTFEDKSGIRKGLVTLKLKNDDKVIESKEVSMGDDGTSTVSFDMSSAKEGKYIVEASSEKEGYKSSKAIYVFKIGQEENYENKDFFSEKEKRVFRHLSEGTPEYEALKNNFGKNMLQYNVKKSNGESISLYDFIEDKNKPTVVLFGYPGCGGCKDMMRLMSKMDIKDYNYVEIITSVDKNIQDTVGQTEKVLKELGVENIKSHILYDAEDKIWQTRLDLKTTPNFMFLDRDGRMVNMSDQINAPVYSSILKESLGVKIKVDNINIEPNPNGDAANNAAFNTIYKMNIGDFELTDLDGNTKKIKDIVDGKRSTLISLGTTTCGSCQNSWKSFKNVDIDSLPFNVIEALIKDYDKEDSKDTQKLLRKQIFDGISDARHKVKHFYYNGDDIYNLPRKSEESFTVTPVGIFLDKDCNIVEFEYNPSYSDDLYNKGKRITETIYE